jgi:hypothetical protein
MNFLINLTDKEFIDEGEKFQLGEIKIGKFREEFIASLSYWTKHNYLMQWKRALVIHM